MARKSSTKPTASKRPSTRKARAKAPPASGKRPSICRAGRRRFWRYGEDGSRDDAREGFRALQGKRQIGAGCHQHRDREHIEAAQAAVRGEEQTRSMQRKAIRHAAEAGDPQSLVAVGQSVSQEAVEKAMQYWSEMFSMIVEMQKRLFALMEDQMAGVPGAKEAKAAMAMMPDMKQAQNLVNAMQGVMASGGPAFSSMQKVMGDFARMAQQAMPGGRR